MHATLCALNHNTDKIFEFKAPRYLRVKVTGVENYVPHHVRLGDDVIIQTPFTNRKICKPIITHQKLVTTVQNRIRVGKGEEKSVSLNC